MCPSPGFRLKRQRFLSVDELQSLAETAGDDGLMILTLGLCGLRFGECAALRVRSVDLLRRRLRVTDAVSEVNGHLVWSTPKSHQSRDVPLPRSLAAELSAQITGKRPDDFLFTSPHGDPVRLANWRRRVWDPPPAPLDSKVCDHTTCGTRQRPSPSPQEHP